MLNLSSSPDLLHLPRKGTLGGIMLIRLVRHETGYLWGTISYGAENREKSSGWVGCGMMERRPLWPQVH